ncbi:hypothetical protein [Aquimarina sp. 2201CG5-10]|uniref:hypothetical protein n=1 Tax=Aquimarina callyspongiae TaxID=3098150 RepID=UPI002AB4F31C|nr:hypothetical protein [Aquimarina sp. 2201CG5-10]MDY8134901.1 hypothetical protein [Aquimarina sp. 2201CG5-10]
MKTKINLIGIAILALTLVIACSKEDETITSTTQSTSSKHSGIYQQHNAPWVLSMDWRFSFGSCATGPGVCFTDGDGDIVIDWGYVNNSGSGTGYTEHLQEAFKVLMNGNNDPDNGVIAFRLEGDRLHMVFSRSLEESHFNITEDVVLRSNVTRELGKREIIIPAGRYSVDRSNFEHGEVTVPYMGKDIILDYHEDYGTIQKKDYPVKREFTLASFLKDLNITENDLKRHQVIEAEFTGIAYAEHLVDGKIIYVWHKYEKEPVSVFEGVLNDGKPVTSQRVHWCGNEFGGYSSFDFFWAFIDNGCWWC